MSPNTTNQSISNQPISNQSTSALLTDRYELTMLDGALRSNVGRRKAVFEIFTRSLPGARTYGMVAGTGRALEAITAFRFSRDELDWLNRNRIVSPEALRYLADYRFAGDVWGFPEGEIYFANSPVLTVEASFVDAVILETVLLSIYNYDCAVASAVTRMVDAADGRAIYEGGARRAHEQAAVAAARAAYVAGATSTSNLEAGRRYNIPTVGTIGHAFVLAHGSDQAAFAAQRDLLGSSTVFLVDTFDIGDGIRTAVELTDGQLAAIRIDSGDLGTEAYKARALLDELGAHQAGIIVSGDLDEWSIAGLVDAPIDGYLVGTSLVTGSGFPTASMVYKPVAMEDAEGRLVPVTKRSTGKVGIGGRKAVFRHLGDEGPIDHVTVDHDSAIHTISGPGRPLQRQLMSKGELVNAQAVDLEQARLRATEARAELSSAQRVVPAVGS